MNDTFNTPEYVSCDSNDNANCSLSWRHWCDLVCRCGMNITLNSEQEPSGLEQGCYLISKPLNTHIEDNFKTLLNKCK